MKSSIVIRRVFTIEIARPQPMSTTCVSNVSRARPCLPLVPRAVVLERRVQTNTISCVIAAYVPRQPPVPLKFDIQQEVVETGPGWNLYKPMMNHWPLPGAACQWPCGFPYPQ